MIVQFDFSLFNTYDFTLFNDYLISKHYVSELIYVTLALGGNWQSLTIMHQSCFIC